MAGFLAAHRPFAGLDAPLEAIAAAVEVRTSPRGDLLIEDGAPADALYVIAAGSVELLHEEEVIDILEPGEAFGHPSLLTGLAPAFTVRAHEPTRCYVLARARPRWQRSGARTASTSSRDDARAADAHGPRRPRPARARHRARARS